VALPFTASLFGPVPGRTEQAGSKAATKIAPNEGPSRFNIAACLVDRPKNSLPTTKTMSAGHRREEVFDDRQNPPKYLLPCRLTKAVLIVGFSSLS
jgi:hypothetical protein